MRVIWATSVANPAGAQGATVTVNVTRIHATGGPALTGNYQVVIGHAQQGVIAYVSNKAPNGFTLTLQPLTATTTIAAGMTDIVCCDGGSPF
jgi:hypothetical protein